MAAHPKFCVHKFVQLNLFLRGTSKIPFVYVRKKTRLSLSPHLCKQGGWDRLVDPRTLVSETLRETFAFLIELFPAMRILPEPT